MKRKPLSLATLAACGISGAMLTADVHAANWDVRVGGYYNAMVAYAETDLPSGSDEDFDGVDVSTNAEIFFLPSITLDNGIKIGANIQLETDNSPDPVDRNDHLDESYVFIRGSFGEVLVGNQESAAYKMHYAAPNAAIISFNSPSTPDYIAWTGSGGANADDVFRGTLGSTFLEVGSTNSETPRITYFTPRFSGFQIGVSYARDEAVENRDKADCDSSGGGSFSSGLCNIFDIGANYATTFGDGVKLDASARYSQASREDSDDPEIWAVGINLGFGDTIIGGSYADSSDNKREDTDGESYDIGVQYATGPWTFSLTYFHGENEDTSGSTSEEDVDFYRLGADYELAKGIDLKLLGGYQEYENDDGVGVNEIEGFVIGTGIGLSF